MHPDRAADSYAIYSKLLPFDEPGRHPKEFLVEDATMDVVQADQPCRTEPQSGLAARFDMSMNPHIAVHPTEGSKQDFEEILEDFDARCHDRVLLGSDGWKASAPVRLLTPAEQKEFESSRTGGSDPDGKYKGATTLYSFSEVYFNKQRTVALVYASDWCGLLCAQGSWVAFGLENGEWKQLRWSSTSWLS